VGLYSHSNSISISLHGDQSVHGSGAVIAQSSLRWFKPFTALALGGPPRAPETPAMEAAYSFHNQKKKPDALPLPIVSLSPLIPSSSSIWSPSLTLQRDLVS